MAAILVSQNNETAAMLVSNPTNPVGVELFSYANAFFCSSIDAGHVSENALQTCVWYNGNSCEHRLINKTM